MFAINYPMILDLSQRPFAHHPHHQFLGLEIMLILPLFTTLKQPQSLRNGYDLEGYICHVSLDFRLEVRREVSIKVFWPRLSSRRDPRVLRPIRFLTLDLLDLCVGINYLYKIL